MGALGIFRVGLRPRALLTLTVAAFADAVAAALARSQASVAALCGSGFLVFAPEATTICLAVLVEEELAPGRHQAEVAPLARIGNGLYDARIGGFRIAILVAVAAAAVVLLRRRPALARLPLAVLGGLAAWTAILSKAEGAGFRASVAASAPWIALLAAFVVGAALTERSSVRSTAVTAMVLAMAAKAAIAVWIYVHGGAVAVGSSTDVYYDSALPFLSGAVVVAVVIGRERGWIAYTAASSGAIILATSMRRNVVFGVMCALLVLLAAHASRRQLVRFAAVTPVVIGVLWLATPTTINTSRASITAALSTIVSDGADASTRSHLNDLAAGLAVVRESPALGVGVNAPARGDLVVADSPNLYIHDEYLQTWARFGAPGLVLLLGVLVLGMAAALRRLRTGSSDLLSSTACIAILMLPATLVFFPQLSTLVRFDLLVGLMVGIATGRRAVGVPDPTARSAAVVSHRRSGGRRTLVPKKNEPYSRGAEGGTFG